MKKAEREKQKAEDFIAKAILRLRRCDDCRDTMQCSRCAMEQELDG